MLQRLRDSGVEVVDRLHALRMHAEGARHAGMVGELQPGAQIEAWATQREDGSWLIDGVMPVAELKARLEIKDLPAEDKGRYNTVAGLLQAVSGRLLATADQVECAGWRFEVVDLDGKRIDKVLASPLNLPD